MIITNFNHKFSWNWHKLGCSSVSNLRLHTLLLIKYFRYVDRAYFGIYGNNHSKCFVGSYIRAIISPTLLSKFFIEPPCIHFNNIRLGKILFTIICSLGLSNCKPIIFFNWLEHNDYIAFKNCNPVSTK
jgi:hypothetical protein